MNEQIKSLDNAAQEYAGRVAGSGEDSNYAEWFNIYKEKFAELLIKECAKVCADVGMQSGGGCTTVGETYLDASKRIRSNFGMESWGLY